MKKSKANIIKKLIEKECKDRKIPFRKLFYRRAKKIYLRDKVIPV